MAIDWKVELEKLKNVDLDLSNIGGWPLIVKAIFAMIVSVIVGVAFFYLVISEQLDELNVQEQQEQNLRQVYVAKYGTAVNLEVYREQLKIIEDKFKSILKQLPTKLGTAELLDDITFVGTTNDLRLDKLEWQPEKPQKIYIELPMDLEVVGEYHQLGRFVSGVAKLSRIISLHDFVLELSEKNSEILKLTVEAKTYRYKDAEK